MICRLAMRWSKIMMRIYIFGPMEEYTRVV
jgi:hypothetical protein